MLVRLLMLVRLQCFFLIVGFWLPSVTRAERTIHSRYINESCAAFTERYTKHNISTICNNKPRLVHPQCYSKWLNLPFTVQGILYDPRRIRQYVQTYLNVTHYDNHITQLAIVPQTIHIYYSHFPHFAELYFELLSLLLWQRTSSPTFTSLALQLPTVRSRSFWKQLLLHSPRMNWVSSMLDVVESRLQCATIFPDLDCFRDSSNIQLLEIDSNVFFLHPADSLLLSSTVLNEDPCALHFSYDKLKSSANINISIINRYDTRSVLNEDEMIHSLLENHQLRVMKPLPNGFETSQTLLQQAQIIHEIDILITPHGAGMTNVFFMRPCAAVIEIYPFHYFQLVKIFFGGLLSSAGILHYPFMAHANQTIVGDKAIQFAQKNLKVDNFSLLLDINRFQNIKFISESRNHLFDKVIVEHNMSSLNSTFASFTTQQQNSTFNDQKNKQNVSSLQEQQREFIDAICNNNYNARACRGSFRSIHGFHVDTEEVARLIKIAKQEREECLKNHPLINPPP